MPGLQVARVVDRLHAAIGLPQTIVVDNGPEFAGRTLDAWAYACGVKLRVIRLGKLIENAYVESFNGKFRDECLNEHWFVSLAARRPTSERGGSTTTDVVMNPQQPTQFARTPGALRSRGACRVFSSTPASIAGVGTIGGWPR